MLSLQIFTNLLVYIWIEIRLNRNIKNMKFCSPFRAEQWKENICERPLSGYKIK